MGVILRQSKTQADFDAFFQAQVDAVQGLVERALYPPELVVGVFDAVQADADILIIYAGDFVDIIREILVPLVDRAT